MPPVRKSARTKGSRTVYSEDPMVLDDTSSSDLVEGIPKPMPAARGSKRKSARVKQEDSSGGEYAPRTDEPEVNEFQDALDDEDEDDEPSDLGSQDDEDMEVDTPRGKPRRGQLAKSLPGRDPDGSMRMDPNETHSRGIMDPKNHVSKFMHYISTFGSDDRDLGPIVHSRGRWRYSRDATFPSRVSLEQSRGESDLPLGQTFGLSDADMENERTKAWDWYYSKETGEKFRTAQRTAKIKETDANLRYLPNPKPGMHTVLLGPSNAQTEYRLKCHDALDISEAWPDKKVKRTMPIDAKMREGWLISVGHKVNCMAWAPNQDGNFQYLAVASPITNEQKAKVDGESDLKSSFRPSPPYPSALQIWEFKGRKVASVTHTLDMSFQPRLRLVICSEWGDLRRMTWCPVDRESRSQDKDGGFINLGLLATIWGDGKVRILDVKIRHNPHKEYIHMTSPAFEAIPKSTICTSVAWLSPSDIAVGCANGFAAVWSIVPSSTSNPQPYFYQSLHSTYVLNIISMYPTNPHLLATVSMDGDTRLCSIIDPQGDTSSTVRVRTPSGQLTYSPILQSVCAGDDNESGRIMPVRRFFGTNATAKVPSSISCISPCSFWHPSLLSGGTGGEVLASNPLRRLLYSKEKQWQQTWFTHDWVPDQKGQGPGISRFYDGFQSETQGSARDRTNEGRPSGFTITTIYDENQHVTALGWNPNRSCAGWGCAALGCGLIRVEDLAT
ncbi:hypothetical protein N7468_004403 [Penicillium chermesinum]|uniref:Transcription factor TFIIIC complex subunit Tfc6 n=1 Tax=Penicillium chermesinum TaxID=63820 RepID=A0A9W9TUA9_9EURO|nr:uncharacterized protein N7468_004403 [Penicillium chermesinum]KAJ5239784.1 hypothetical protein N7468_004403 [Penicillium chermesinum]KAJ6166663.1 hypothetical protein N7470_002110 [Penicillium chermesinum]